MRVIDWDGTEIPAGLRELPPGRYVVEPIDGADDLTPDEDAGLRLALDELEAGNVRPLDDVFQELRDRAR